MVNAWKVRNTYMVLVWKPQGKKPLGRPGHGQKDIIKIGARYMA
jgi:hypothetical protein